MAIERSILIEFPRMYTRRGERGGGTKRFHRIENEIVRKVNCNRSMIVNSGNFIAEYSRFTSGRHHNTLWFIREIYILVKFPSYKYLTDTIIPPRLFKFKFNYFVVVHRWWFYNNWLTNNLHNALHDYELVPNSERIDNKVTFPEKCNRESISRIN